MCNRKYAYGLLTLLTQITYPDDYRTSAGETGIQGYEPSPFSGRISHGRGLSTIAEMQRELEIKDYTTIWVMAHKIRKAMADGWQGYKAIAKGFGLVYYGVILSDPKDSMKLLHWTHQLIVNAKSVFQGAYRGVSTKHLQSYLSGVCYHFNRRFGDRQAFHRLLTAYVSTITVTRNELLAPIGGEQSQ